MKRTSVAVMFSCLSVFCGFSAGRAAEPSGPDFVEIARRAPGADSYPGADAVYLLLDVSVGIDAEGAEIKRVARAVKIFNAQGRREFSDYRIPYDSEIQEVAVRTARTIRDNLRITEVEKDAINDITPSELEGASIYSSVLEKVLSFPSALSGSVFALEAELRTRPRRSEFSGGAVLFQADQPILESRFALAVPDGLPVVFEITNPSGTHDFQPRAESTGGRTQYRWDIRDMPRAVPETHMPPAEAIFPRLVYSTAKSWGALAAAFGGEFFPRAEAGEDLSAAVGEWVRTAAGAEERIREVFLHVVRDVRSVNLDLGRGGYRPNPAAEVYHHRYGDCRDKAVLLVAALETAGIEAYPVLYDRRPVDLVESVPTLSQFNDVMVAVAGASGYRFLDPTAEYCLFGYCPKGDGNRGLLIRRSGYEMVTIPEVSEARNYSDKRLRVAIRPDGAAEGVIDCSLGGRFDHRARLLLAEKTAKERDMEFDGAVNRLVEGATRGPVTLSDPQDLETPMTVSMEFGAEAFGLVQGEMMIVRVPEFPLPFANTDTYPGLEERVFDFVMDSTARDVYCAEIDIPSGYEPVYVPPAFLVEDEIGRFAVEASVDREKNRITITRTLVLRSRQIAVEDYPRFKNAYDAVTSAKNSLVLLEKTGPKDAKED